MMADVAFHRLLLLAANGAAHTTSATAWCQEFVQANFDWVTEPALWLYNWEHLGARQGVPGVLAVGWRHGMVISRAWKMTVRPTSEEVLKCRSVQRVFFPAPTVFKCYDVCRMSHWLVKF